MTRRLPVGLLLLTACGGGTIDADGPDEEPTPWILDEEAPETPDVDLDALSDDLQRALGGLWGLNAAPLFDAYDQVAALQTEACPRTYTNDGNTYWFDQCTTEGGDSFSGYGFAYRYQDYPLQGGWTGDVDQLQAAARVETAEGHALDVAGGASLVVAVHDVEPAVLYRSTVRGTFAWDGPASEDTWLRGGAAPDLTLQVLERTDYGGRLVQIEGGVGEPGGDLSALVFDGVTLIEDTLFGACPSEPAGVVSARLADGTWVDLTFDGPSEPGEQVTGCDGKGTAWVRGEPLGEVAVDFSVLFDLQGAPW